MFFFGEASESRLVTCDQRIILVCREVIEFIDFSVACGYRSMEEQARLYAQGRTEPGDIVTWARPGQSRHNFCPSQAVDVWPYPVDWEDREAFGELAGALRYRAWLNGFALEWGGHWRKNKRDLPHLQIAV